MAVLKSTCMKSSIILTEEIALTTDYRITLGKKTNWHWQVAYSSSGSLQSLQGARTELKKVNHEPTGSSLPGNLHGWVLY